METVILYHVFDYDMTHINSSNYPCDSYESYQ